MYILSSMFIYKYHVRLYGCTEDPSNTTLFRPCCCAVASQTPPRTPSNGDSQRDTAKAFHVTPWKIQVIGGDLASLITFSARCVGFSPRSREQPKKKMNHRYIRYLRLGRCYANLYDTKLVTSLHLLFSDFSV